MLKFFMSLNMYRSIYMKQALAHVKFLKDMCIIKRPYNIQKNAFLKSR